MMVPQNEVLPPGVRPTRAHRGAGASHEDMLLAGAPRRRGQVSQV